MSQETFKVSRGQHTQLTYKSANMPFVLYARKEGVFFWFFSRDPCNSSLFLPRDALAFMSQHETAAGKGFSVIAAGKRSPDPTLWPEKSHSKYLIGPCTRFSSSLRDKVSLHQQCTYIQKTDVRNFPFSISHTVVPLSAVDVLLLTASLLFTPLLCQLWVYSPFCTDGSFLWEVGNLSECYISFFFVLECLCLKGRFLDAVSTYSW